MRRRLYSFVTAKITSYFKSRRWELFLDWHEPKEDEILLDLGGGDGGHLAQFYPYPQNIILADIDSAIIHQGMKRHGIGQAILLDEDGTIPLTSQSVDIVFCNSVIEHVTGDKKHICNVRDGREFRKRALACQSRIAREITRVGKKYWVQTPYKLFPLETHTWLLGTQFLPRPFLIRTIKVLNRFWIKKTSPDFHLLSKTEATHLFPHSEIIFERFFGFPKSLIIRTSSS